MKKFNITFERVKSQMKQIGKEEGFETLRMKKKWKGLTVSWTCRFNDGKPFKKTGLSTGETLHFMTVGKN